MKGYVDARRRPTLPVLLRGPYGRAHVDAGVDTGGEGKGEPAMLETELSDDLAFRGKRYYDEHLKQVLEPEHNKRFVAVDVDRADHAVADDPIAAYDELDARGGAGPYVLLRVGCDYT